MRSEKRAQAGPAGGLLALLAVFILLYMLLIPPDLRNELLEGDSSNRKDPYKEEPGTFKFNETLLDNPCLPNMI